jgi:hypothetical protein
MNESSEPAGVAVDRDVGRHWTDNATREEMVTYCRRAEVDQLELSDEIDRLRAEVAMQKRSRQMDVNEAKSRECILRAEGEALRAALILCVGWVEAYGQPETRAIVRAALTPNASFSGAASAVSAGSDS